MNWIRYITLPRSQTSLRWFIHRSGNICMMSELWYKKNKFEKVAQSWISFLPLISKRSRETPLPPQGCASCLCRCSKGSGYSSDSACSRGKTLVFPRLRQFLELQLFCQTCFCMERNFLLIIFLNIFQKLWMLLLLLSLPNIIRAACCLRSCHPTSSAPPSSGCTALALSPPPPSSGPMMNLHCPVPQTSLLHHPDRVEGGGCLHQPPEDPHWSMPCLAVRDTVADRQSPAWRPGWSPFAKAVQLLSSGSHFPTRWFLHLQLRCRQETVQEQFLPPWGGGGFARPGPATPSSLLQTRYPQRHQTLPTRLDLWPFSSKLTPELGGSTVEVHFWKLLSRCTQRPHLVLILCCTVSVYQPLWIQNKLVLS